MPGLHDTIISLYERHAASFDKDRGRSSMEQPWLDRFLTHVPPGGAVLDIGCGMAEPIAASLIGQGFRVTGIDSSPSMIQLCRERFPAAEWMVGDTRTTSAGCSRGSRRTGCPARP